MDVIDEFDINIIKKKEAHGLLGNCCDIKISNTMVHQRINQWGGIITGIKPIINEKKIGYDWEPHYAEKDEDSSRIIEELKRYLSNGMLLYYWFLILCTKMIARDHEHMRKLLYEKIDTIQGIAKRIL
jgi:Lrp/AsnC family transcriptional regulator for asnA, asnC and gidA